MSQVYSTMDFEQACISGDICEYLSYRLVIVGIAQTVWNCREVCPE